MPISFIPNDPEAVGTLPKRRLASPRPDRPANIAGYNVAGATAEGEFAVGTPEFLFWQCREAALAALDAWEAVHGPFASWQDDVILPVFPNSGDDLNAYYDRASIRFFHKTITGRTYFSGASTDVVAHEAGHGFLDAIRPDFWTSNFFEVNAFHEAFGDCVAILTALEDKATRTAILPSVAATNPAEATAEELAAGIAALLPNHNAGVARHARNTFQWGPSGSLPDEGGPGELIYEVHSFGQVFSGCFYDCIVNVFQGLARSTEASLLAATRTVGKLLVAATRQAPQREQHFREVGRMMVLVDEQTNAGANRTAIRDAFDRHGIALGSALTLAPQAAVGPITDDAPSAVGMVGTGPKGGLSAGPKRELLKLFGAETTKLTMSDVTLAGQSVRQAVHQRAVPLDGLNKKLKGVVAEAPQVALLGRTNRAMSVLGQVATADGTVKDVEAYVKSLLKHGAIDLDPKPKARGMVAAAKAPNGITHEIREVRGQRMLMRLRFACGCRG